jgi:hypothetical protein
MVYPPAVDTLPPEPVAPPPSPTFAHSVPFQTLITSSSISHAIVPVVALLGKALVLYLGIRSKELTVTSSAVTSPVDEILPAKEILPVESNVTSGPFAAACLPLTLSTLISDMS